MCSLTLTHSYVAKDGRRAARGVWQLQKLQRSWFWCQGVCQRQQLPEIDCGDAVAAAAAAVLNSGAVGAATAAAAAAEVNSGAVGALAAVHTFHSLAAAVVIATHLCAAAAAAAAPFRWRPQPQPTPTRASRQQASGYDGSETQQRLVANCQSSGAATL